MTVHLSPLTFRLSSFVFRLRTKYAGFTLIELLVTISLSSIMVVAGISAYSKGEQRQLARTATNTLLGVLESTHQNSLVGNRPPDCLGTFQGYLVETFSATDTITITSTCDTVNGSPATHHIPHLTFTNSTSFTFKPLATGVDLGSSTSLNLDYLNADNSTYRFTINNVGKIESLGVIE